MSEILNDDKAKGNPRAASTRIKSATSTRLAGQIRHDLRRGPQPAYVDAERAHLNRVLIEPLPPGQMRKICESRRAIRDTKRGMKSNAAVSTVGVITFGAEAAQMFEGLSIRDQDRAFKLLARVVARRLGTSVHGLTVHNDEATIHAHYQLAAYNRFGSPISKSTSPKVLSELQDLTAQVMQRFCPDIERGRRYGDRIAAGADFADTIHKSVAELHRTLPADLAAKREALADLADDEAKAQARVDEMQDRVNKLAEKAELSDKEVKRLATYEKRLTDRLDELRSAQASSEAAKAEADRLVDLARTDHDEMRAKVERSKLAAGRIKADAEARAVQMTQGAKMAAEDIRDEIKQDRDQLEADRAELTAEFMRKAEELDEREADISHKVEILSGVTRIIRRAVDYLGEKLGLPQFEKMRDAIDQIENKLDEISPTPKSSSDALDEAGPGF